MKKQLKENIKQKVGTLLVPLMPKRAERIKQESFSMTVGSRSFIDACLRAGIAQKMLNNSGEQELSEYHRQFWEHENCVDYHKGFREFVVEAFDEQFSFIADELNELLRANPQIDTLVEIGCGGGSILNHLLQVVDGIDRFVGVDLSADIIAENAKLYTDPKLEWVADNAQTWIEQNGQPNWVYFSFRGVLEYFTQDDLGKMYADIATRMQPAIFISMEPMALDHDLSQDNSRPYGTEYTWSHNYPHLYTANGFTLKHQSTKTYDDHHICSVVATAGLAKPVEAEPTA